MKFIIATEYMNTYPNYEEPFDIYNNASDYQVDAVIIQEGVSLCSLFQPQTIACLNKLFDNRKGTNS